MIMPGEQLTIVPPKAGTKSRTTGLEIVLVNQATRQAWSRRTDSCITVYEQLSDNCWTTVSVSLGLSAGGLLGFTSSEGAPMPRRASNISALCAQVSQLIPEDLMWDFAS